MSQKNLSDKEDYDLSYPDNYGKEELINDDNI